MSAEVKLLREAAETMRDRAAFWPKVALSEGCWIWLAARSTSGYGRFWSGKRFVQAHRFAYEEHVGVIPPGGVIDHLCRVRLCVRPDHLEVVTHRENVRRGAKGALVTVCSQGHRYDDANTYVKPNGCRDCRECRRIRKRKARRCHL